MTRSQQKTADNKNITAILSSWATDLYRHIMNGVSYILPFVIAGGIIMSLAMMFGFSETDINAVAGGDALTSWLMTIAGPQGAFGLLAPVIAGFIGLSIAERVGLMPAMVGGFLLAQAGAGLIGGIVAGVLGGYGMLLIKWSLQRLPVGLDTVKAILLYPLLGLLWSGSIALLLMEPLAAAHQGLLNWLVELTLLQKILLGAFLGSLMALDLGGPINKIAYTFSIIAIAAGNYLPAAAAMAAGMVPPLALGLATYCFSDGFSEKRMPLRQIQFIKRRLFCHGRCHFVCNDRSSSHSTLRVWSGVNRRAIDGVRL